MKFYIKPNLLVDPLIPDDNGDLTGGSGVGEGDFGVEPTDIGNTGGNSGGINDGSDESGENDF